MGVAGQRVLVTGADGFIGSHLVERLVADGAQVRAFCLYNPRGSWGWLDELPADIRSEIDVRLGDIRDMGLVRDVCRDIDTVFHLAALIAIPHSYVAPESFVTTNVNGTLNVLEAVRRGDVARMVHTSTSEVYGTPSMLPIREDHPLQAQSPYAATKVAADQLALAYQRSYGTPVTILRPFNTYGPRQSARAVLPAILTQLLAGGDEVELGRLDTRRDLTFVTDTVDGFIRAARVPGLEGRVIQLGTGRAVQIQELFDLAVRAVGRSASIKSDPRRLRPDPSEVLTLQSSPDLARSLLDWEPQVSLEEGIGVTTAWLRSNMSRIGRMTCMSDVAIPLSEPSIGGNAASYLEECLRTNFVSSVGPFVARFEQEFATSVGIGHAVACVSGTAALHVAFRVLGIGPGDEVFVPTLTFIASANAAAYLGARLTLVDSEAETWNLDPRLVADEVERRARSGLAMPKAIEVVHLLGHPADIEPLMKLADEHGILLVEDAAEALGAVYRGGELDGRQVGTLAAIGCFSFNGNKVMTTGGGGMLVTAEAKLALHSRHLTTQARLPGLAYQHDEVGYNYRLSNLAAALGVAQLELLSRFLEAKQAIADRYDSAFEEHSDITPAPRAAWAIPSHWLYSIRLTDPEQARRVIGRLNAVGVGARPMWTPLHRTGPYRDTHVLGGGVMAEAIAATTVSLPSSVALSEQDQRTVITAVLGALR